MKDKDRKKGNKIITLLIILGVLLTLYLIGKAVLFPKPAELRTTGKYEVTSEDYWVTEEREDPFLKDGSAREVQVRVWYPKNYEDVNTRLPIIIASHGSCGSIDNNRSLYKEFASHGYVVLALSHPGHAFDTIHSDGTKQSVSMDYLKEMGQMDPQTKLEDTVTLFAEWMDLRMTDMDVVMNEFKQRVKESDGKFSGADADRFIVVGHSAGGSAAYGMARTRADVIGVIALESPCMYDIKGVENGDYIIDESDYDVPLLNVYSDSSYSHLREWKQYRNNVKFLESEKDNYTNIYYEGVGHMGLCDLSLASPILARILDQQKSQIPPSDMLQRLNQDCLAFVQKLN